MQLASEWGMLRVLLEEAPRRSRHPIYLAGSPASSSSTSTCSSEPSTSTVLLCTSRITSEDVARPQRTAKSPRTRPLLTPAQDEDKLNIMPIKPATRKTDTKMGTRRFPPGTSSYRPKSRTDSTSGSRLDSGRLRGDVGGAPLSSDEDATSLDLRQRLQEEASLYRKRLDTYRRAQQDQTALVSRLQAKVLQYKQKCADLEAQLPAISAPSSLLPSALEQAQMHLREIRQEDRIDDLESAMKRLDEERAKTNKLMEMNTILRKQLEDSHNTNEALTADLQKLTNDWENLREEMIIKEDEWKDEEQAFNDYYSTEHNRLLNLWRDVVSMKRLFMDVQISTERDLTKLKTDFATIGKDMSEACFRIDFPTVDSLNDKDQATKQLEMIELKARIEQFKMEQEQSQRQLEGKDERIQELLREVHGLEERCADAEQGVSQMMKMQEDVDILQNALTDIAHALIQDAETKEADLLASSGTHVHLTATGVVPQKSPKRTGRYFTSPAAFAESTISAVQAALHKYQSLIHELQVKLQSNKEQLLLVRRQHENSDQNCTVLETRIKELVSQLDTTRAHHNQLLQERDSLQKTLETLKSDKNCLERHKIELNATLETLQSNNDKLQSNHTKLQQELDILQSDRSFLQAEIDRLNQEATLREIGLRAEEDRCSRLREELVGVREELNKSYLHNDVLEQQKIEQDTLISHLERHKNELEAQLDRLSSDTNSAHETLAKKDNVMANLEEDKRRLAEDLKRVDEEKMALQAQFNDLQNDMQSLRKELLQAEQAKLDLESDKVTLGEKCKFLDIEKSKIEMELSQVTRDRNDLSNQLTLLGRKKEALNEELMRTRQRLEQASETNARINRNLEELVKECESKQCDIGALEKESQRLQELLAAARSEKEALEAILFDTQTNLESSENRRTQLEHEQQELLVKQEQLKGQVAKLQKDVERSEKRSAEMKNSLIQQAGNKEAEFKHTVEKLRSQNEDIVKKLTSEKEKIRHGLEKRLQQNIQQLTNEKDTEIQQLMDKVDALQGHCENLCQQHEELMVRAENDKQQALLIAHHDHQALHDRFEALRKDLESERDHVERLKRDATAKFDQDRTAINQLKEELAKYRARLEEAKTKAEEEKVRLERAIDEVKCERDTLQNETENVRVQLHLCEDKCQGYVNQLHDTIRKQKEAENLSESLRKELTDTRRLLADSNLEKDKYHTTNKELRDHIKRIEGDKREQTRQLEEAHHKIATLDELRQALEAERSGLQARLAAADRDHLQAQHQSQTAQEDLQRLQAAATQLGAEEKELQARLLNEVEERERAHQETHTLKKQLGELERALEVTRAELAKTRVRCAHLEEQHHAREQDLLVHLEDLRAKEKRLEDQKHNLEVCLVDATQQIQELKAKVGGGEGRVRALEAQLVQLETSKREIEQKLFSIVSTLRRIAGIQFDGSVNLPYRLLSPSRRWSPARGGNEDGLDSVDPEVVRKGVRNLMQQVAQIERERDDYKTQLASVKKQLQECHELQSRNDGKLNKSAHIVRTLQEEKSALAAQLSAKQVELQAQTAALRKKTEECEAQREKLVAFELQMGTGAEQKAQLADKVEKLKMALARSEAEKRALQEELARIESRAAKMELQRMSADGDLTRLQMMLQEKEAQAEKVQEKCEAQSRTVACLEERCVSLKATVDQLNGALEKAAANESELRAELQTVQRALLDVSGSSQAAGDKLKQLQKSLSNNENERRVLAERLDASQHNLAELRRNNQLLQDQLSRLNTDLANNEVQRSALESQLRLAQWPSAADVAPTASSLTTTHRDEELQRQLTQTQRERNELRNKVDLLNHKIRQLEAASYDTKSHQAKSNVYQQREKHEKETTVSEFEEEHRELRAKISRLELELESKETELLRLRTSHRTGLDSKFDRAEMERYRAAQLQAERLLEAREHSHRQQVARLESQIALLRDQLNQEIKRRQQYVLRSTKAGREMQQLRQTLGDSLRTVSQDPSLDALLLEHEARRLDSAAAATTASLPAAAFLNLPYARAQTPQPK